MDYEKIGRTRMMVRLPRHRAQLAKLNFSALTDLLADYGEAVVKRDELRATNSPQATLDEYDEMCQALEDVAVKLIEGARPRILR